MSLFFSRILKHWARRANSCFFSSVPRSPYLIVSSGFVGSLKTPEGTIVQPRYLDPSKKKETIVCGGKIMHPNESHWFCVAASRGWMMRTDHSTLHLTDAYMPWVSSPRVVSLPYHIRPSYDTNVLLSLSSSDPVQDDDCLVATKFDEFGVSVCSPRDSQWTHIESTGPNRVIPGSSLTYSKRHEAFYFAPSNAFYLGSVDLSDRNNYKLKYHHLRLRKIPSRKISVKWRSVHDSCRMTQHLVDSPSGELFYILRYTSFTTETLYDGYIKETLIGPKRFMVFREDETTGDFNYTDDIGDLCIFLGSMNESFSVSANMYPGLKPNSIYYTYPAPGPPLGCYSLASAKTSRLSSCFLIRHGSFWIHPADPIA